MRLSAVGRNAICFAVVDRWAVDGWADNRWANGSWNDGLTDAHAITRTGAGPDDGPYAGADPSTSGWFKLEGDHRLKIGGVWRLSTLSDLSRALQSQTFKAAQPVEIDAGDLTALDSAGAQLLIQLSHRLSGDDAPAAQSVEEHTGGGEQHARFPQITNVADRFKGLIQRAADAEAAIDAAPRERTPGVLVAQLENIGRRTFDVGIKIWELVGFLGLCITAVGRVLLRPWTLDFRATAHHLQNSGLNALPIVGLLAFLVGIVVAFMGAMQLQKFSAEIFTVDLVGISLLRELGVLFAAIMVAGRSGSAFTAQIGTMSINEEVDAMRAIGLDPIALLVVPRIVALVIALPLLTIYANLVGLAGGAVISSAVLDISFQVFLAQLAGAVDLTTLAIGLSKAPIFAAAIAIIGCFEGFKVAGSAGSVGRRTTTAVVEAIFMVILIDAAFAVALSWLGI